VDGTSCIVGVRLAQQLSVLVDGAGRAAGSNIQVHGDTAVVGFE
jgi:hypothetical protein